MKNWIRIHGIKRIGENKYACINCGCIEPLMYGYRIRLGQNIVRMICRCRNCRRLVSIVVEDWDCES